MADRFTIRTDVRRTTPGGGVSLKMWSNEDRTIWSDDYIRYQEVGGKLKRTYHMYDLISWKPAAIRILELLLWFL